MCNFQNEKIGRHGINKRGLLKNQSNCWIISSTFDDIQLYWNFYILLLLFQTMNYFYLPLKRINTESMKDHSAQKLRSTASSKRFNSTPKEDHQGKNSSSDFKTFKIKHRPHEQEHFNCFNLIKIPYPSSFVTNADLLRLDFSPLSHSVKELIIYAKSIIESNFERKMIGKSFNLLRLIQLIADSYRAEAYHNFTHAFSVLLLLFQSYSRSEQLQKIITQKQWFYVFIASLIHDINHPGTNNAFEIKQKSQLAIEAGNQSVLEKMHLNVFWKLLKSNSQINFLQGYSGSEANEIKKLITRLVISTDATRHAQGVEGLVKFQQYKKSLKGENAMYLIQQLFHACDIGNSCLPFENYLNWSVLVTYQFDRIAAREQELGLEVTESLKYEGLGKFYRGQLGFTGMLVLPLWKEICNILPDLDEMLHNITENMQELERRISCEEFHML